jgi:molecular chaperone GrpE
MLAMSDETKITEIQNTEEQTPAAGQDDQPSSLESEIASLRQQLETKDQEAKSNHDRFLRQVAELENFKKRMAREREEAIRFANEALIKELLPVVDNLERAVAHAVGGGDGKPLVEGVEMVLRGFLDVLGKYGVSPLEAVGQTFDPSRHEAMAQVESDSQAPNTIVAEHQRGYLLHQRLLRPALVTVSKSSKSNEKKNEDDEVEKGPSDD